MIILITLLLAAGIFVFDVLTPLGLGEWGLYLIPLLISFQARELKYPYLFSGLCTVLVAAGFWFSKAGMDMQLAGANRIIGIAVLWLTAALLVKRKSAEAALKDIQRRLSAIMDHSPMAIFVKDLSGRYVEYSHQSELITGKTRSEVVGRSDHELFPEEVADEFIASDYAAIKAGEAVQGQRKYQGKDGMRVHLIIKFPLFDQEGKCIAVGGVSADVTELKQAEQALRDYQERFHLVQVTANIGSFESILATKQVIWSPGMQLIYGMKPGTFGGKYENWAEMIHPEDRARVEGELGRALTERRELKMEYRIVRADGAIAWVKSRSKIFYDEAGVPERLVGINIEITDQKKAQEAMAFTNQRLSLLAQVTAAVVGSTPLQEEAGKLAEQVMAAFGVDACVIRTLRGESLELLASAGVLNEKLQPSIPADGEIFREIMACRQPIFIRNASAHAGTKPFVDRLPWDSRFLSYAGAPLLVQDKVAGILGIYSKREIPVFSEADLGHLQVVANHIAVAIANDRLFNEVQSRTRELAEQNAERERAEDALKQTTEQLQALSRRLLEMQEAERRHIARELHDEIGQALTALKINLQAVQRTFDPGHAVPRLLDSISIVDRTLRQVRNLSLDLRPSMLDDLGLCAALRWYADQQAQRAGLRVQFAARGVEGRLDPMLETACFRVAQEALTNVVRHAQAQNIQVELAQEKRFLHLTVRDDGVGFNLVSIREQVADGMSAGLLGMEERAALAGGRIELKSSPDSGTEVHVWFPVAYAKAPHSAVESVET